MLLPPDEQSRMMDKRKKSLLPNVSKISTTVCSTVKLIVVPARTDVTVNTVVRDQQPPGGPIQEMTESTTTYYTLPTTHLHRFIYYEMCICIALHGCFASLWDPLCIEKNLD